MGAMQVFAADAVARARFDVQVVAAVDQHKDRLQQVVAVSTPPDDMQKQIELGWRGQVVKGGHGGVNAVQDAYCREF